MLATPVTSCTILLLGLHCLLHAQALAAPCQPGLQVFFSARMVAMSGRLVSGSRYLAQTSYTLHPAPCALGLPPPAVPGLHGPAQAPRTCQPQHAAARRWQTSTPSPGRPGTGQLSVQHQARQSGVGSCMPSACLLVEALEHLRPCMVSATRACRASAAESWLAHTSTLVNT